MSGYIYNAARFHQKANFQNMLMAGSDIDFFCEVRNKIYIFVEWKTVGTGLPTGQALGYRRLVSDLGQVKPSFCVVAYHDTNPQDDIDGENSFVGEVFYRLPNMSSHQHYIYDEQRCSLNEWLADFSAEWRLQHIIKAQKKGLVLWEGVPQVNRQDWDGEQLEAPSAFFDHIRPVRQAYEYV